VAFYECSKFEKAAKLPLYWQVASTKTKASYINELLL